MLLLYCGGAAQAPALYFDRITVQNGLSHNKVNCILQDKRGFLWIGTDDGLNRYDGSHFSIYKNNPGNNGSLSGNIITDLLEDEQQVLWIATADGGLTKYDYRLLPAKQFTQFKHQPGNPASLPVNIINKLLQDEDGYLWLATSGSYVVRFNKKTGACSLPVTQGTRTMLALTNAGAHEMWVGKQGGGLLKINTRTLAFRMDSRYNNLYAKLPHATVTSLYKDHFNNIWYGSWDSVLYQYNQQQQQELLFQKNNQPNSFSNDDILGFAEDTAG
ncbi:MAG TPA: two-component regulator propeller domain-containing protein, partial [Chitinophagaceae bacterium]|nr:two-component regulator propeller domain-containing protein [Chitinophagaceae bacterium]